MAGQIIRRGDRKWMVRVYMGTDTDTKKRRYHNKTVSGSKKDAERYLAATLRSRDLGTFVEPTRMSLNSYLDRWLEDSVKPRVRPRTLQDYNRFLDQFVRPVLGNRRLDSLRSTDIQSLYTGIGEQASAHAVVHTHRPLRAALRQAVRWQMLARNPAEDVAVPKEPRGETCALSAADVARFHAEAAKHPRGFVFTFTLATGLRPGEVQALRWKDCDLDAGSVTVKRNLVHLKGGRWEFGEPKTRRSCRTIPLPRSVARDLQSHRATQSARKLRLGGAVQDNDLVFANETGGPLDAQNLAYRTLKPILRAAGLPTKFRWYDCRHTCATVLLSAGENPKVVSERLGHASVAFTLDRYASVLPGMQEEASERLERILTGSA